jgi:hypothetical protein
MFQVFAAAILLTLSPCTRVLTPFSSGLQRVFVPHVMRTRA